MGKYARERREIAPKRRRSLLLFLSVNGKAKPFRSAMLPAGR
jgi:hypothetical protein